MATDEETEMEVAAAKPWGRDGPDAVGGDRTRDLDQLGDEICSLASSIAAATARFLVLLREYDERQGWRKWEMYSFAHWLAWRCAMSLRTAQEHVRVARSLADLPQTQSEFLAGRLSFSKVRAISRVGTPANEADLVGVAQHATATQVENLCRGLRAAARTSADPAAENLLAGAGPRPPRQRHGVRWHHDPDTGDLILWGRFSPDEGAVLLAAVTRAELERVRVEDETRGVEDETRGADTDEVGEAGTPEGSDAWRSSVGMLRTGAPGDPGPALVAMAMMTLTGLPAPAIAPAAEVLYIHQTAPGALSPRSAERGGGPEVDGSGGCVIRVLDGPALAADIADLVTCTARRREVIMKDGAVLNYGRRRRLASPQQVKALLLRDQGACQTPGCGRRGFLHAHHVIHWARGGPTDLDNLLLLCSACHTAVHQGRVIVSALGGQRFQFRLPDTGASIPNSPPTPKAPASSHLADELLTARRFSPTSLAGGWDGSRLNLSYVTHALLQAWAIRRRRAGPPETTSDAA